jgi:hypothetical protein
MVKSIVKFSFFNKSFFFLTAVILAIINIGCEDKVTTTEEAKISFKEFYIEKGSDFDTTYISFKGTIKNSNTLLIEATSWGILEVGLSLDRIDMNKEIMFGLMGQCGTIFTHTWAKVTFSNTISAAETDTLERISFTNFRDTIVVNKSKINKR